MNATHFAATKQAWVNVEREAARLAKTTLLDLFATDPDRVRTLTVESPHLIADFSKQRVDAAAMRALGAFAAAADFDGWRAKMFSGAIVNNISMASYMPNATNIGYHVSKAAARMLTLCGAIEFGPRKIRVNSVHPGMTMTPLIREGFADWVAAGMWETEAAAEAALAAMAPLGISSQPEDAAHAFVYLASEESRFVTGASIYHDGGIGQRY